MKATCACLVMLLFCVITPFRKAEAEEARIPLEEIDAVAVMFENKETGEKLELERNVLASPTMVWGLIDSCRRVTKEYSYSQKIDEWDYLCCPVTADGVVHCEAPLRG